MKRSLIQSRRSCVSEGVTASGYQEVSSKIKLAPRYIGPYPIIQRIRNLAYKLQLPEELAGVHPVFHVSQLYKCLLVPEETVPQEVVDLQETLEYVEYHVKILD